MGADSPVRAGPKDLHFQAAPGAALFRAPHFSSKDTELWGLLQVPLLGAVHWEFSQFQGRLDSHGPLGDHELQ